MSPAFLLTTLVVVVTPGTGVVYTLAAGPSHGRRAGVVAAPGSPGLVLRRGAVFTALTLVVFAAYGMGAAAVRDRLTARPRIMTGVRRVFAVRFAGPGARTAVA